MADQSDVSTFRVGSIDFVPVDTLDPKGDPYSGPIEIAIHRYGDTATDWQPPTVSGDERGFRIDNLPAGYWCASVRLLGLDPFAPILPPIPFLIVP